MNAPQPSLAVVICTHNPRPAFLTETLAALRAQTLPNDEWDLLIIDNASTPSLLARCELGWHPRARIVDEPELGIAHARARALRETAAYSLLLFVDDDNLLEPDYLAEGLRLAGEWPQLGAWGGQLLPRFEVEPPLWTKNYLKYLAVRPLDRPLWTNRIDNYDLVPPTAGCFVRQNVRARFLELIAAQPMHLALGERGRDLMRGEDMDLLLTAIDLGLGLGLFPSLRLQHLIPAERLTLDYFTRLITGVTCGHGLVEFIRHRRKPETPGRTLPERLLHRWRAKRLPSPLRELYAAEWRGRERARELIAAWSH